MLIKGLTHYEGLIRLKNVILFCPFSLITSLLDLVQCNSTPEGDQSHDRNNRAVNEALWAIGEGHLVSACCNRNRNLAVVYLNKVDLFTVNFNDPTFVKGYRGVKKALSFLDVYGALDIVLLEFCDIEI